MGTGLGQDRSDAPSKRPGNVQDQDQLHGEYLGKEQAVADATEVVNEARAAGGEAEVWDEAKALRLY